MLAFYPLILSKDPSFQIKQFFNVKTIFIKKGHKKSLAAFRQAVPCKTEHFPRCSQYATVARKCQSTTPFPAFCGPLGLDEASCPHAPTLSRDPGLASAGNPVGPTNKDFLEQWSEPVQQNCKTSCPILHKMSTGDIKCTGWSTKERSAWPTKGFDRHAFTKK